MDRNEAIDSIFGAFYGCASDVCGDKSCYKEFENEAREALSTLGVQEDEIDPTLLWVGAFKHREEDR